MSKMKEVTQKLQQLEITERELLPELAMISMTASGTLGSNSEVFKVNEHHVIQVGSQVKVTKERRRTHQTL